MDTAVPFLERSPSPAAPISQSSDLLLPLQPEMGSVDPERARRLGSLVSRDGAGLQAQPRAPSPGGDGARAPSRGPAAQRGGEAPGVRFVSGLGPRSQRKRRDSRRRGRRAGGGRARDAPPRPGEEPQGAVRGTRAGAGCAASAGPPGVGEESERGFLPLSPWQGHRQPWA